ncbi:general secretion pathway protein GspD [Niveibacterium sp. 24ML]|uniref:secretin N-terminal domain-containing protein n=1 Tax=Niveibacterium sp. 24ML TaxID=2985512 RepID=UPI00226E26E6|nr:secretin N-terminal domain-containing protein [Niveibacterium sp. 24ML]MCX9155706.1 general secretion pathway protein GspD [Niveibacterium sp. 24ML]
MTRFPRLAASALLAALLLTGCAGQKAFRAGIELSEQKQYEAALEQYRAAIAADPNNAEYRLSYLKARDQAVALWLAEAERAQAGGRSGEATPIFMRVLRADENNARAIRGLRAMERDNRHAQYLAEAQSAYSQGDLDGAQARLRIVLSENPAYPAAVELNGQIEQRRAQPRGASEQRLSEAFRKPISIEFRDAQLNQVFEVISRASGLNFVLDREVRGDQRTTIFLRNSTVANALALTLLTNQLEQRVLDASSVLIYPATTQKLRDYQALAVKTFMLANGDAKNVANTLRTILKTRDVVVDEKQNMLIVRDTPEALRMAERLILLHDQAPPEVMLEVEILEVQRTRFLKLGIEYPGRATLTPLASNGKSLTLKDLLDLGTGDIGVAIDPLSINANRTVSDVRVLANPRIRVLNREKAKIVVGQKVPSVTNTTTSTGFVAGSVSYLDVGLKLEVEPTVSPDGEVTIKMALEVSNIIDRTQQKDGTVLYQLGTRNADTMLRLHDGENQVLAGLIDDSQSSGGVRIPGLGDIPGMSRLFGSQTDESRQSEVVLSITPRIVRPAQRPAARDAEFEAGTEASLKALSLGEIPPPASGASVVPPPPPSAPAATQPAQPATQAAPTAAPAAPAPAPATPVAPAARNGDGRLALRSATQLAVPPASAAELPAVAAREYRFALVGEGAAAR